MGDGAHPQGGSQALMNVLKTGCRIVLVFLWFRIIGKTIKTLGFPVTHIYSICQVSMCHSDAYSEPCQTSKMERFAKRVNDF